MSTPLVQAVPPVAPLPQPQVQNKRPGSLFAGISGLFGPGMDSHPPPPNAAGHQAGAPDASGHTTVRTTTDEDGFHYRQSQVRRTGEGDTRTTDAQALRANFGERGWEGGLSRLLTSGTGENKTVDRQSTSISRDPKGFHFAQNQSQKTGEGDSQATTSQSTSGSIGKRSASFKKENVDEAGVGKDKTVDTQTTTASLDKTGLHGSRVNSHTKGEGADQTIDSKETKAGIDKEGLHGSRINTQQKGEGADRTIDSQETKAGIGKDGLTGSRINSHTKGEGADQTTESKETKAGIGKDGLTGGRVNTVQKGEGADQTTTTKETTAGISKDGLDLGRSSSQRKGDEDNNTTTSSNASVKANFDGVTIGGGKSNTTTRDGEVDPAATRATSGSIGIFPGGANGPSASAALSHTHGNTTIGGGVSVSKDTVAVDASVGYKGASVGVKYENVHNKIATEVVEAPNQNDDIGQLIDGHGYVGAKRLNSTSIGGTVGVTSGAFSASVSAGKQSGSSLEVFDKTPPRWDKMSQKEKDGYQKKEVERLKGTDGLAKVDVGHLPEGAGVSFNTYNGWNAGGSVSYGSVGLDGSHSQSSEHQVSLARNGDFVNVSMTRQDNVDNSVGMHLAGVSLSGEQQKSNAHRFQFKVDVHDPKAMESMQKFMQTGLLPGADKLKGAAPQAAAGKLNQAKTQVDTLSAQIDALKAKQKAANNKSGANPASADARTDQQELATLNSQLNSAQQKFEQNRNYLNDTWEEQLGVGKESMPGVQMQSKTHTQEEDTRSKLGIGPLSVGLGGTKKTTIDKDYLDKEGQAQSSFAYAQQNFGWRNKSKGEQSTQTDTNQDGVLWQMDSRNDLDLKHNADIVKSIANRDVPDYMLDSQYHHRVSGETHIALTQQQMTAMSTNMNDMTNPQSKDMWKDFSARTSELFSDADGKKPTMGTYGRGGAAFAAESPRDKLVNDIKGKGKDDPLYKALKDYGVDPEHAGGDAMNKVSQQLATIKSPDEFQKLKPEQQLLFVKLLKDTSGHDKDPSGKRNSYEAVAAISLMADPKVVAEQERSVFKDANDQARHDHRDGTVEFVKFAERFKDDPSTFSIIQKSLSFEWHADSFDKYAKDDPGKLQKDLKGALNTEKGGGLFRKSHKEIDAGKTSAVIIAAQKQGGPELVKKLVTESGMDPREVLEKFHDDPTGQHLFYDMMQADGYGGQLNGARLDFKPTAPATDP